MEWLAVSERVRQIACARADHPAIEWGDRRLTYAELQAESACTAVALQSRPGWQSASVVAILSDNPFQLAASILGTLDAGGAFAPMDLLTPVNRLGLMLDEVAPACLLADAANLELAHRLTAQTRSHPEVLGIDACTQRTSAASADRHPGRTRDREGLSYLYFTSGSTGSPKAIAGRLCAIDHFVQWEIDTFEVDADSRVSQLASPAFDAWLKDVFVPLCAGGTVCVPTDRGIIWQPAPLADWIDASGLTHLQCVPSVFRTLLNAPLTPDRFPALRHVLLAGEPLLPSDADRWMSVFDQRIRLTNLYGPSETTLIKMWHPVGPADRTARTIPIGRPIDGAAVMVVDEAGVPCAPGVVGEIWIRTPFRALGYYGRREATNAVFIVNPFTGDPDDIVYRTGDLGRLRNDGELEFVGRVDEQVKIRGARIELSEIEELLRRCEAVSDAVVIVSPSANEDTLCACVVLREAATIEMVTHHLASWLPPYMIPSRFVVLEAFPRTDTGKVDRRALRDRVQRRIAPAPQEVLTPLQQEVAEIWTAVLNVPAVGLEDNFFDLGGHSLRVIQVASRLRRKFEVDISIADVFAAPTLGALSETLRKALELEAIPRAD